MDEEDDFSTSEFCCPEDLETFHVETVTGISESQEAIDDFINKRKSANTNKKTATNMNTLVHYLEGNGMIHERIESLPATKFFMNTRRKDGEEYEPATFSNFQRKVVQNEQKRRIGIESDEDD